MPIALPRARPGPRRPSRGAALVEPLVASLVAGLLAATALPRLSEATPEARAAALAATAGAATSAMQLNQMGCALTDGAAQPDKCLPVRDCAQVGALLLGGLPPAYAVPAQALAGSATRCTVTLADGSLAAEFIGIAAGR